MGMPPAPTSQLQQVLNPLLAPGAARHNLLTNGGFEIWQRGVGPFTANLAFTADRWVLGLGSGSSTSVTRSAANSGPSGGSTFGAQMVHTQGAAGSSISQTLRLTDNPLKGQTLSFSVRVYATVAGTMACYVNSDGTTVTGSSGPATANTWQTLTATLNGPVPNDATYVQVGVSFAASGTFFVDNAMLVVGSVAADYAPLHPADDLARCQRYYEIHGTAGLIYFAGYNAASQVDIFWLPHKMTKAVTPTITIVGSAWNVTNCSQPTIVRLGMDGLGIRTQITAAGAYLLDANASAANAIAVEANP